MLIKCPECQKDVSDQAESCIHCGFPLKKTMPSAPQRISMAPTPVKRAPTKKCTKCGAYFPATDSSCPSCGKNGGKIMEEKRYTPTYQEQPRPNITCPTCHSTDVEKVSLAAKAVNIWAFGLFGNKRNKQFKCKCCGYMW